MEQTILIVEDHDVVRALTRDWLSAAFPDCRFLEARTRAEAVVLAHNQHPDIVLVDTGLPQIGGIETLRCIKAAMPQTQVVILTVHEAPVYRADALAAGAVACVPRIRMHTELIPVLATLLSQLTDPSPNSDSD